MQSKKTLTIRNRILGGPVPWICLPLVAEDRAALLQQAKDVPGYQPDALEWRADKFEAIQDAAAVLRALDELREAIGDLPLIFTCRAIEEGGFREIAAKDRLAVMEAVIASGKADLIDAEISNGPGMVAALKRACLKSGAGLILSYHNFDETPEEDFITGKLSEAVTLGGDVAKVAVMPRDYGDVLTLLNATYKARTELLEIPIITLSMGREGGVTRIAGGLFGSDLTFAVGSVGSAPGQIPIKELRQAWEVLPYGNR